LIAIVGGTGPEGSGLALRLARAGEEIVIGSRDAARAQAAAAQIAAKAGALGSVEGVENTVAVKMCDTVVLTVPFAAQADLLKQLKPTFRQGTVLIDATVPLAAAVGGRPTRILGVWQGSAAEQAAEIAGNGRARLPNRRRRSSARMSRSQPPSIVSRPPCSMAIRTWTAMSSSAATTIAPARSLQTWR